MNSNTRVLIEEDQQLLPLLQARVAEDLNLLASLHDHEPELSTIEGLDSIDFPKCLTFPIDQESEAIQLLSQSIRDLLLISNEDKEHYFETLAADYASIYLTHSLSASPSESVWIDEDSLMCQESMFQVRNWYLQYELAIPDWRIRSDDHLVYQLQFIAILLQKSQTLDDLEKAALFMDEHLLRWLGNFSERVSQRCETRYFASLACVTTLYCEQLRDMLAELLMSERPTQDEIEARMIPSPMGVSNNNEMPLSYMPGMGPVV